MEPPEPVTVLDQADVNRALSESFTAAAPFWSGLMEEHAVERGLTGDLSTQVAVCAVLRLELDSITSRDTAEMMAGDVTRHVRRSLGGASALLYRTTVFERCASCRGCGGSGKPGAPNPGRRRCLPKSPGHWSHCSSSADRNGASDELLPAIQPWLKGFGRQRRCLAVFVQAGRQGAEVVRSGARPPAAWR